MKQFEIKKIMTGTTIKRKFNLHNILYNRTEYNINVYRKRIYRIKIAIIIELK